MFIENVKMNKNKTLRLSIQTNQGDTMFNTKLRLDNFYAKFYSGPVNTYVYEKRDFAQIRYYSVSPVHVC